MIKFYAFLSLKMVEISRFFTNYGEKIKISFFDHGLDEGEPHEYAEQTGFCHPSISQLFFRRTGEEGIGERRKRFCSPVKRNDRPRRRITQVTREE